MRLSWILCFGMTISVAGFSQSATSAAGLMHAGLAAMGGEEKIRTLSALRLETVGQRNMLEQSERPEGPYIVENSRGEEWREFSGNNWKRIEKLRAAIQPEFTVTAVVAGDAASIAYGDKPAPGSKQQLQNAAEALALSPERVMIPHWPAPSFVVWPI